MPSLFDELENLVSDAVDHTFSEMTRIEPRMQDGVFSGSADPDRQAIDVIGIPDFNPVTTITKDTAKYDGARPAVSGDKIHVSYDVRRFTSWLPKQGDIIKLIDRSSQDSLKVSRVDADGLGRIVCVCDPA